MFIDETLLKFFPKLQRSDMFLTAHGFSIHAAPTELGYCFIVVSINMQLLRS